MATNNTIISSSGYDCDIQDIECFSPETLDPWETDFAALTPRFSGSASAISSALIIYMIMMSETRLSSIYHRIMFGMSLADFCASVGMALTSLPMPSYMPKEEIFGYKWAGTRLGNTLSCDVQGFFVAVGMSCMFNYNGTLCAYYACAIAFAMKERNVKKYVEPFLHAIPIVVCLVNAAIPLAYDLYNPGRYAWCGPIPYPEECTKNQDVECIRGSAKANKDYSDLTSYLIMLFFLVVISSLIMVVWKVVQTQRLMTHISKIYGKRGMKNMQKVLEKHANTKAVLIQAVSYIAAFLLSLLPPLLMLIGADGRLPPKTIKEFEKLSLVMLPLQGFFNCVIFISHKVYNYRRAHRDATIWHVIRLLLTTRSHDPLFISRISVIMQNEQEEGGGEPGGNGGIAGDDEDNNRENNPLEVPERNVVYEFFLQDESNDELVIQLGGSSADADDETDTNHAASGDRSTVNEGVVDSYAASSMRSGADVSGNMDESFCGSSSPKEWSGLSYGTNQDGLSYESRCTGGSSRWNVGSSFDEKSMDEEKEPTKFYYKK